MTAKLYKLIPIYSDAGLKSGKSEILPAKRRDINGKIFIIPIRERHTK